VNNEIFFKLLKLDTLL